MEITRKTPVTSSLECTSIYWFKGTSPVSLSLAVRDWQSVALLVNEFAGGQVYF